MLKKWGDSEHYSNTTVFISNGNSGNPMIKNQQEYSDSPSLET